MPRFKNFLNRVVKMPNTVFKRRSQTMSLAAPPPPPPPVPPSTTPTNTSNTTTTTASHNNNSPTHSLPSIVSIASSPYMTTVEQPQSSYEKVKNVSSSLDHISSKLKSNNNKGGNKKKSLTYHSNSSNSPLISKLSHDGYIMGMDNHNRLYPMQKTHLKSSSLSPIPLHNSNSINSLTTTTTTTSNNNNTLFYDPVYKCHFVIEAILPQRSVLTIPLRHSSSLLDQYMLHRQPRAAHLLGYHNPDVIHELQVKALNRLYEQMYEQMVNNSTLFLSPIIQWNHDHVSCEYQPVKVQIVSSVPTTLATLTQQQQQVATEVGDSSSQQQQLQQLQQQQQQQQRKQMFMNTLVNMAKDASYVGGATGIMNHNDHQKRRNVNLLNNQLQQHQQHQQQQMNSSTLLMHMNHHNSGNQLFTHMGGDRNRYRYMFTIHHNNKNNNMNNNMNSHVGENGSEQQKKSGNDNDDDSASVNYARELYTISPTQIVRDEKSNTTSAAASSSSLVSSSASASSPISIEH